MSDSQKTAHAKTSTRNRRVAVVCFSVAALMVGAAFAAVPLYDLFCRVTGYGGTTQRAEQPSGTILGRTVTIRFDATNPHKDLVLKPKQRTIRLRIGETAKVAYIAENKTDKTIVTTATFNVTPDIAGPYFDKMECFCFTEQTLKPGERVDMPVVFYVDPEMALDKNMKHIDTITLSYTFYVSEDETAKPVAEVSDSSNSKENL